MSTRWRLFFSYVAVIVAMVAVLSVAVRVLAIRSVNAHMAGMGGSGGMMTGNLKSAVTAGVNEAILWGALAAVIAAVIAS